MITQADEATLQVMREICQERGNVQETNQKWPMVMIRNADSSLKEEDIAEAIVRQNPDLGVSVEEAPRKLIPSFKRGPRDQEIVHWVCRVHPDLYKKLANTRIYLGFSYLRVTEYFDYMQCAACHRYGHREAHCTENKIICGYCAETGHREVVCNRKSSELPPKCTNCKGPRAATFARCSERVKAVERVMRFTSYK